MPVDPEQARDAVAAEQAERVERELRAAGRLDDDVEASAAVAGTPAAVHVARAAASTSAAFSLPGGSSADVQTSRPSSRRK